VKRARALTALATAAIVSLGWPAIAAANAPLYDPLRARAEQSAFVAAFIIVVIVAAAGVAGLALIRRGT
jgi:hypothetical protein